MDIAIHTNQQLAHQRRWALALYAGFKAHGLEAVITSSQTLPAPVHVIQGPHYALEYWQHERVLYLDRCFYGSTHEYCSLGWRNPDGSRDFMNAESPAWRWRGKLRPWKYGERRALVIADYGTEESDLFSQASAVFPEVRRRLHPAAEPPGEPLSSALKWADVAIGRTSSALVQAILAGVPVICTDPHNIVAPVASHSFTEPLFRGYRRQWCYDLAFTQWHVDELTAGDFVRHLRL